MGMSSTMITKAIDTGVQSPRSSSSMSYSNSNCSLPTINETPILLGRRILARISLLFFTEKECTAVRISQDELYMNENIFINLINLN